MRTKNQIVGIALKHVHNGMLTSWYKKSLTRLGAFYRNSLRRYGLDVVTGNELQELTDRRNADAELAGTNSCVDDKRLALLFLKHRQIAKDLQKKYIVRNYKEC